ncbi:iron-containing alcohol dehydrogenase [Caloramator sp. E03]|uniref:iron-containing alcohol dehydrogenase n=1 Tax=Caloramator sp. E03 TaxID=2576307 RepID=UPI0011105E4B|nr:iron-containing alcohol dehydrogenase [Caloramator sp. E03]QCX33778.1 iron-containing alcohol dehydrogenase [Caloramator sp. E03]
MKELKLHGNSIIIGKDSLNYIENIDIKKAFIVTGGNSMFKIGAIDRLSNILKTKKAEIYIFSDIKKNPSFEYVLKGLEIMKKFKPDTVIGIGGGSSIDIAKALSVFYEYNELDIKNPNRLNLPKERKNIKLIAIPSTSGTAAEVTRASVITYNNINLKIGLKCDAFIPDIAILDSSLTLSMPKYLVAETGMDALTHAVECYINKNINPYSEALAEGAIKGLFNYLPSSYEKGDLESREKVHIYSTMAGSAFSNVGLGMAHGISHAFGGKFDFSHGLLNAVALPYVLRYNSRDKEVKRRLNYLSKLIDATDFIEAVITLNKKLNIPSSFKDIGLSEKDFSNNFSELLENSLKGSTKVNPIEITENEMKKILYAIYYGKKYE